MTKVYCYTVSERIKKTARIMTAFAKGCGGKVIHDEVLRLDGIAIIWGQIYSSKRLMQECEEAGIPFYQIDNGYFKPANGNEFSGYYRVTKNKLAKNWIEDRPVDRWRELGIEMRPWRASNNGQVVLCVPGHNFGAYLGLSMDVWAVDTKGELLNATNRKILIREKTRFPPLVEVLDSSISHCVVTHSSNAAVDAIIGGYPAFCDEMCAARPVGNSLSFKDIETPVRPERVAWASSLAYGQFTLDEMEEGLAWSILNEEERRESSIYRI